MNNEDMSELFNKFSNMINEGNIPDEMKNILSAMSSNNSQKISDNSIASNSTNPSIDFESIMKMKSIMDKMNNKDDPRAKLLMSLKPYLKDSRKEKVDQYIKLFGMSKAFEMFNNFGGEK